MNLNHDLNIPIVSFYYVKKSIKKQPIVIIPVMMNRNYLQLKSILSMMLRINVFVFIPFYWNSLHQVVDFICFIWFAIIFCFFSVNLWFNSREKLNLQFSLNWFIVRAFYFDQTKWIEKFLIYICEYLKVFDVFMFLFIFYVPICFLLCFYLTIR